MEIIKNHYKLKSQKLPRGKAYCNILAFDMLDKRDNFHNDMRIKNHYFEIHDKPVRADLAHRFDYYNWKQLYRDRNYHVKKRSLLNHVWVTTYFNFTDLDLNFIKQEMKPYRTEICLDKDDYDLDIKPKYFDTLKEALSYHRELLQNLNGEKDNLISTNTRRQLLPQRNVPANFCPAPGELERIAEQSANDIRESIEN